MKLFSSYWKATMEGNLLRILRVQKHNMLSDLPKKPEECPVNSSLTVVVTDTTGFSVTKMEETIGNNNPAYKDDNNTSQEVVTIPEVFIEIEEDPVFEPELEKVLDENDCSGNYLTIPDNSGKGNSSRSSSRLSSTISIISLASTNISNRLDAEAARAGCHRCFGLGLAFLSGVLMTAYSSMIKMLGQMDSMQVVIMRGVLQMVVMLIVALYKKLHFFGDKSRAIVIFLFLVAFTGGLRLIFIFTSFSRLPLGDSTAIIFSSPVLVMLFSICILKVSSL